jgi:hypothetical protein
MVRYTYAIFSSHHVSYVDEFWCLPFFAIMFQAVVSFHIRKIRFEVRVNMAVLVCMPPHSVVVLLLAD